MTLKQAYEALHNAAPEATCIAVQAETVWHRPNPITVEWTVSVHVPIGGYRTKLYQTFDPVLADAVRDVIREMNPPKPVAVDLPALDAQLAEVAAMNDIHGDGLSELDANGRA